METSGTGRPSDYRPEYCEMLKEHMAQGLSFETFGATIGSHRSSLYRWLDQHPAFRDAKREAFELNLLFWEKAQLDSLFDSAGFNTTAWIFNMKNRFGWRDRPKEDEDRSSSETDEAFKKAVLELTKRYENKG